MLFSDSAYTTENTFEISDKPINHIMLLKTVLLLNRYVQKIIVLLSKVDKDELLTLWLADQVAAVVAEDRKISDKVLNIVKENIK